MQRLQPPAGQIQDGGRSGIVDGILCVRPFGVSRRRCKKGLVLTELYTAGGSRANRDDCISLGVGLMLCDGYRDPSAYSRFAVDNGAYSAWQQSRRWNPATFTHILTRCAEEHRAPDFAVLPDIVGGGYESLKRSHHWRIALDDLFPGFRWALAVQDGMSPEGILGFAVPGQISTIFVGGTMTWKISTMEKWATFAHGLGMTCHVGRMGSVRHMLMAERAGADSIDSTTWIQRKGCLKHHVETYRAMSKGTKLLEA